MTNSDKSSKGVLTNPEPLNEINNSAADGELINDENDSTVKENKSRIFSNHEISSSTGGATASSDLSDTTLEELYKMRAHGRKGYREPTRIEFDLMRGRGIRKNKLAYQMERRMKSKEPAICNCMINKEIPIVNTESSWSKLQKNIFTAKQNIDRKTEETLINSEKIKPNIVEGKKIADEKIKKTKPEESSCPNMEIYYFDHGNSAYFRTTDCPPNIATEIVAQQTTYHATKFWAEIFGAFHVGIAFFVAFILQTFRFVLYSTVRPLIVGFLQMTSDYLVKPTITILFNGLLQPPLILLYNIFSSICDMLEPVARTIGHFLKPIGELLKSIRLVEIHKHQKNETEIV